MLLQLIWGCRLHGVCEIASTQVVRATKRVCDAPVALLEARTSARIYLTSRGLSPARRRASPNLTQSGVGETTRAGLPETRC